MSETPDIDEYQQNRIGFQLYLHDLADALFPFPGYRDGQGEALKETIDELYINDVDTVILALATGVGKSPLNVTLANVTAHLYNHQREISNHFGVELDLDNGGSFYTTPQKQLRNQLAEDDDLNDEVQMLASRADYICGVTGQNCNECSVKSDPDDSCMDRRACTYWSAKQRAMASDTAALTFAMLIVDKNLPVKTEQGRRLSFANRDLMIVDEGHGLEGQAASMFAGFSVSPWSVPQEVFGDAGRRADWDDDRFGDVKDILRDVNQRARNFIRDYEDVPAYETEVEQCENFLRKLDYALREIEDDRPWVVNVTDTTDRNGNDTKAIKMKPVYVDDFLENFVWSRGSKQVISSATVPFRGNITDWTERIGTSDDVALISKPMPFPVEHRLIHNLSVGSMSGEDEENNWHGAMQMVEKIHSHHQGENGLIHTNSYKRANKVADSLGRDTVFVHPEDKDAEQAIEAWQEAEQDIMVSPSMTEGVDLHGDRCRWQVLLKVPFGMVGDSRVSYLLNELHQWDWYYQEASIAIQQSVGRAVRGPEPEEAASYYVVDSKFDDVMERTSPPEWFTEAIVDHEPEHWHNPQAAPWR